MNKINIGAFVLAASLGFSAGSMANDLSKDDGQTGKNEIATKHKSAEAQMKIAEADATAKDKSAQAHGKTKGKTVKARKAAVASTLESQYGEEKKKCETYSGSDKVFCLDQAKARFGKP